MLQLYDLNKVKISKLTLYKDLKIQSVLSNGDKTLSFSYPSRSSAEIKEEGYIRTKTHEFVIKEISTNGDWKSIKAVLNVEDLEGKSWEHFDTSNQTITECLTLALAGTGWIIGYCNETKKRTIRKINCSTWDIIQDIKKTYFVEMEFDTLNKRINIAKKLGNDKGVYFIDSLNLRDLDVKSNSYDFCTRLIAIGEDDLKVTVENYQYSSKKKTIIWKAEKYTDENSLREDAIAKLEELSKPYKSYGADIVDLASINNKYSILSYGLGDIITLISKQEGIKEKQRIVKMVEYPDEPDKNTCEIANTILTFEDMQKEYEDTSKTVNNITSSNGTISEGAIKGTVEKITINKADIQNLNAVEIRVGDLEATSATITQLDAANANIVKLQADKADITELNAGVGRIEILESSVGDIQTLVNGNITSNNIQSLILTSDKVTVGNGFIKNAMIENLDVSKINSGDISTNKFKIKSDNGGIEITGATQQFKDKNNRVRIQMGQDIKGDFNFILRGEDGTTTLIDHTGVKEKAIGDDLIRGNMISENAVGGKQIDYNSFTEEFNKDTNTHTLKSSKIFLDRDNQTLDIAFDTLSTTVDEIEVGGRNLLIDSHFDNPNLVPHGFSAIYGSHVVENSISKKVITLTHGSNRFEKVIEIKEVGEYTYTIFAKLPKQVEWRGFGGVTDISSHNNEYKEGFSKYSVTFTVTEPQTVTIMGYLPNLEVGTEILIDWDKLEKGNKPTDWSPSPEDIDASIKGVKTITESNTTAIGVVQGKITTLISNTTIVKDGQNIQLKDAYNSTVATVNSINSVISSHTSTIDALTGQVNSVDTKTNEVRRDLDGTIATVSNTTITANSALSKATEAKQTIDGFTQRVSTVEQTAKTIDGKVSSLATRMNTAEQKITDSSIISTVRSSTAYTNDLGAKVSTKEIISCINQTSEAIKISANKINLSGYVTLTNLSTAGQSIIDGGNVKTNTISLERLKSATNNPIIRLFGKCSLDATANGELGVGSAVRLKWDPYNYLYISTNKTDIYQGGISKYTFNPAGLTVTDADVIINSGFLVIGGKKNRGWGFSSGNRYWFGLSGDDVYVRMYNDAVSVLNGVSYLGSPSGRFIKLYSTQAADVSSDRRKKTNILAYDEKIETFYDNLKPISYELINGHSGRKHYGFIAQDVEDAMDVAGLDYKDMALLQKAPMDAEGNEIDPTTIVDYSTDKRIVDYEYSLAYTEMISINTHMIQKLRAEITQLKNKINEIKGLG